MRNGRRQKDNCLFMPFALRNVPSAYCRDAAVGIPADSTSSSAGQREKQVTKQGEARRREPNNNGEAVREYRPGITVCGVLLAGEARRTEQTHV